MHRSPLVAVWSALVAFGAACQPPAEREDAPVAARIAEGQALYRANGCAACHGRDGRGDGPLAPSLRPPPRDTPEVLREHLSMFDLAATGLTGTVEQIAEVARLFGASYAIEVVDSEAKYFVSHTTKLYALDGKGRVRLLLSYEATTDEIVTGIRSIL